MLLWAQSGASRQKKRRSNETEAAEAAEAEAEAEAVCRSHTSWVSIYVTSYDQFVVTTKIKHP